MALMPAVHIAMLIEPIEFAPEEVDLTGVDVSGEEGEFLGRVVQ